jgi:vacuolar iron transporter family protein
VTYIGVHFLTQQTPAQPGPARGAAHDAVHDVHDANEAHGAVRTAEQPVPTSTSTSMPAPADGDFAGYQGPSLPKDHHRDVNGGWLRPAVFGVTDGLVSNFSLLAGMAGGAASHATLVLTGLAGLVAGACSMAAGEYISVASQTEVALAEIEMERLELARRPAAEMKELAEFFAERGVDPELAYEAARQIHRDPAQALIVHVQEELGVDPGDLPSPVVAAVSSFGSFAVGALLPLLPYLLGLDLLWPAALLAFGALFTCGAVVSRVSSRTWWFSGLRQLGFGMVAAAVTFGLGTLIGSHLG